MSRHVQLDRNFLKAMFAVMAQLTFNKHFYCLNYYKSINHLVAHGETAADATRVSHDMGNDILLDGALEEMRPRPSRPNADIFTAVRLRAEWNGGWEVNAVARHVDGSRIDTSGGCCCVRSVAWSVGVRQGHVGKAVLTVSTEAENVVSTNLSKNCQ